LNYLRSRFTDQLAWTGLEKVIEEARRRQTASLAPPSASADKMQ